MDNPPQTAERLVSSPPRSLRFTKPNASAEDVRREMFRCYVSMRRSGANPAAAAYWATWHSSARKLPPCLPSATKERRAYTAMMKTAPKL